MSAMHDTGNAIIAAYGIRSIPGTSDSFKAAVDNIIASLERSAQYERDLHDGFEDRSQDVDCLRAGFLQRGAEIGRLEDGIKSIATGKEGVAQVARQSGDEDTAIRAERDAADLRNLLGEDGE